MNANPSPCVHPRSGDIDLAGRIVAGDESAFEQLMRQHNRRLFRLARVTLRHDGDAEQDPALACKNACDRPHDSPSSSADASSGSVLQFVTDHRSQVAGGTLIATCDLSYWVASYYFTRPSGVKKNVLVIMTIKPPIQP